MARREPEARTDGESGAEQANERVRFDKWLWAARFFKTRTLAAQAVEAGQARIGNERVKPAHAVHVGDTVAVRKAGSAWDVRVTGLSDRRGSATDAALLYAETDESRARREQETLQRNAAAAHDPRFPGRPTKRQRRRLEDFLNEP
jgi:ribosome-associated heat shock protein Hsp15